MAKSSVENLDLVHYIAYPINPGDVTAVTKTDSLLRDLTHNGSVVSTRKGDLLTSWVISSEHNDLRDSIGAIRGILEVEKEEKGHPFAKYGRTESERSSHLARRGVGSYTVAAKPSSDVQELEKYLRSKIQPNEGNSINQMTLDDKVIGWAGLVLDDTAKSEVEGHPGLFDVIEDLVVHDDRALVPDRGLQPSQAPSGMVKKKLGITGRSGKWEKQEEADWSLVMDSQYPGSTYLDSDFVHVPEPGQSTFIYVIEDGINLDVQNEDENREFQRMDEKEGGSQWLQTAASKAVNEREEDDEHPASHGTAVASKAAGRKYGLAKEKANPKSTLMRDLLANLPATVISVKITKRAQSDYENGFAMVLRDLEAHPDRQHRSVVVASKAMGNRMTYDFAKRSVTVQTFYAVPLRRLFALGVPFVTSSGNNAKEPDSRPIIDELPQIFSDDDIPIITVGAATIRGERADFSQYGNQLTVYAPGAGIECQSKEDHIPTTLDGTSFSAPQVAGLIATYLSHEPETRPWKDKSGVERVRSIRNYLVSDASSWERTKNTGIHIIWNGATKEDHDSVEDDTAPPPPPAAKTKALSIILQNYIDEINNENTWLFFATDRGVSALCRNDKDAVAKFPAGGDAGMVDNPPWPGGSFKVKIDGMDCEYKNDGTNPGALWCNGRQGAISCQEDALKGKKTEGTKACGPKIAWSVDQHPVAFCEW